MVDRAAAEALLYEEAACLDDKRWRDWLALFTEDAVFWMPSWASESAPTTDPELELNLIYLKGRPHLEDRVFRIESGDSFASTPMARTAHVLGNVQILGADEKGTRTRASWIVHAYGGHGSITRGGRYEHLLREEGGALRIAHKKVVMIDDKLVGPVDIFHV